ncbi:(2Fe-2S) ferredoxin domain-containing protein [Algoriphagus persicinus]|uniref:(2Fe-2S) ferredoxin domain-containing protein n=1 Tax=Algoriphagus persicinus TaxID=3108754 RepID=UPI002B3D74EB|nr:(2Fe-2S) ferredoxin domain-containing protein [Algoriphagus sp. E1-3-M2]MEB2785874.1 (2Fe-2S) ferredoxin domain-containing protein [Algoriphagus sp. E1-3-M2]
MKHTRKLVFICIGSDCKKQGAKKLYKELKGMTDEAALKGSCKFIKTKCMDMCKTAPNVIVGDHFCKKATAETILVQIKKS